MKFNTKGQTVVKKYKLHELDNSLHVKIEEEGKR